MDTLTERTRASAILAMAGAHGAWDLAAEHIARGSALATFREALMLATHSNAKPVGLSRSEIERYSLTRAILAFGGGGPAAGFEAECSAEIARTRGGPRTATSFYVPLEVLARDMTAAGVSGSQYLVATENLGFIDVLRNRAVALRLGAQTLSGLVGNVTVPRQSAAATAYWLADESTQITEGQPTIGQLALSPKTVGAYTEISRQLLLQSSPAAEAVVRHDLANVVALAIDLAALNGSGASGQPTGILNTAGIGSVTGTSLAYAGTLEFQSDVLAANAPLTAPGYVTTPAVATLLQQRVKFTSTASPLWEGATSDGTMNGYRAMATNQMPAATMIFGDWSQLLIAEWGNGLELMVNPFASFTTGIVGVRALHTLDIAVRHAAAFSAATSIT